jgi:peptide/nickel transport system substrate-binding protein
MQVGKHKLRVAGVAAVAALALAAAGCGGSSPSTNASGARVKGGTVTIGFTSGATPTWIWSFVPGTQYSVYNAEDLEYQLYLPLYAMGGNNQATTANYGLSPANAPVFSNGGKTITITMKGWKWSDGSSVDASDVAFWLNMLKAEKANYGGYTPGLLPDNMTSFKVTSPNTIVINLSKAYGQQWFVYNQLSDITPLPAAQDVTKAGAAPGSGGCDVSVKKCAAVFNFLNAQAKATSTYATNPVWAVVDGPYKLSTYSPTGNMELVPNSKYSGSPKASVSLKYVVYTDDTALYTAMKSGSLDQGTIPVQDLAPRSTSSSTLLPATNPLGSGYYLKPAFTFGTPYFQINFKNPTAGPMFKQLYFRQALAYVNDQNGIAKAIDRGYGYPTTGPVPSKPASQWLPSVQTENGGDGPYPFSIAKATALLTSHGWKNVSGVMTCEDPAKCGAGIAKGAQAKFTMDYASGIASFTQTVEIYKSDASKAGIDINLVAKTFVTLIGSDTPQHNNWQMSFYGQWVYNGPGFIPTGEPLFQTGSFTNAGSYSSPTEDKLISEVQTASSTSNFLNLFHQYAAYTSEQQPIIFFPQSYAIVADKSTLKNVGFNPYLTTFPQYWYFVK